MKTKAASLLQKTPLHNKPLPKKLSFVTSYNRNPSFCSISNCRISLYTLYSLERSQRTIQKLSAVSYFNSAPLLALGTYFTGRAESKRARIRSTPKPTPAWTSSQDELVWNTTPGNSARDLPWPQSVPCARSPLPALQRSTLPRPLTSEITSCLPQPHFRLLQVIAALFYLTE